MPFKYDESGINKIADYVTRLKKHLEEKGISKYQEDFEESLSSLLSAMSATLLEFFDTQNQAKLLLLLDYAYLVQSAAEIGYRIILSTENAEELTMHVKNLMRLAGIHANFYSSIELLGNPHTIQLRSSELKRQAFKPVQEQYIFTEQATHKYNFNEVMNYLEDIYSKLSLWLQVEINEASDWRMIKADCNPSSNNFQFKLMLNAFFLKKQLACFRSNPAAFGVNARALLLTYIDQIIEYDQKNIFTLISSPPKKHENAKPVSNLTSKSVVSDSTTMTTSSSTSSNLTANNNSPSSLQSTVTHSASGSSTPTSGDNASTKLEVKSQELESDDEEINSWIEKLETTSQDFEKETEDKAASKNPHPPSALPQKKADSQPVIASFSSEPVKSTPTTSSTSITSTTSLKSEIALPEKGSSYQSSSATDSTSSSSSFSSSTKLFDAKSTPPTPASSFSGSSSSEAILLKSLSSPACEDEEQQLPKEVSGALTRLEMYLTDILTNDRRDHVNFCYDFSVKGKPAALGQFIVNFKLEIAKGKEHAQAYLTKFYNKELTFSDKGIALYDILNKGQNITTRALGFFGLINTTTINLINELNAAIEVSDSSQFGIIFNK